MIMKQYIITKIKNSFFLLITSAFLYSLLSYIKLSGWCKNRIILKGSFLRKTKIKIQGRNNSLIISPENRLNNCLIYISGDNCQIKIDKHCILKNVELWIEDNNGKIEIGYRSTIEGAHISATEGQSIIIGEDCMFSHGIDIRNGDSHSIVDLKTGKRTNHAKQVVIGNHVWLGSDVKVLKGSIVKDGSIISTGAIITGQVDANSIYAGIPAKKIKENINWQRKRIS